MSAPDLTKYLTTRQVADRVGLSKSSVDQYARSGALPSTMTPLGRMFLTADVDAFAKKPRPMGRPKAQKNKAN
jgi:excisionase family DNA binding protein